MRLTFPKPAWSALEVRGSPSHLPKFQTGKHANYRNDISELLSMKIIGILLLGLLKNESILVADCICVCYFQPDLVFTAIGFTHSFVIVLLRSCSQRHKHEFSRQALSVVDG